VQKLVVLFLKSTVLKQGKRIKWVLQFSHFFVLPFYFNVLSYRKSLPPFVKIIAGMGKSFSPQQGYEDFPFLSVSRKKRPTESLSSLWV